MDDDEDTPAPVKQISKEAPQEEEKKIQLSEQDVQEFREIFNLIDTDGSGCISPEELGALIEQVGLKITQEELDEMVREIDVDGSGEIDFHEFLETMSRDINPNYSPNEVCRAFKMFARSAPTGLIKMKDLDEALKVYLHGKVDHMDIHNVLKAFDDSLVKLPDSEELYFNYMDYVNLMMPDRPGSDEYNSKSRKTMDENMAGLGSALDKVRNDKKDEERKNKREQRRKEREAKAQEITQAKKKK